MMHPATRLVAWAALVVFAQLARGSILWGFGLVITAVGVVYAQHRVLRLLRRVRFLLLVLVVLFAFFTPGELFLPLLGAAGPTREGISAAALHCGRLVVVVMLVALLLEKTGEKALVSGLMSLARPFTLVGLPVERLAVRMLLVFRYVESPPPGGWRALLTSPVTGHRFEALTVAFTPLLWRDRLAIAGLFVLMIILGGWL